MRIAVMTFALSLALVACGGEEKPATPPEPPKVAEPPKPPEPVAFNAQEAFNTTCSPCHGTSGLGDGAAGAALDPKPASFADAAFWTTRDEAHVAKVIKEGGPSVGRSPLMAPFGGQFNDEQIAQLASYVKTTFAPK